MKPRGFRASIMAAGGVVHRENGAGKRKFLLVHRPRYDDWSLPKGKLNRREGFLEAALREVREETGLLGRVLERIDKVEYWYRWKENDEPVRYHKIVYFFLIEHQGGDIEDHDFEVDEVRWFPLAEAERMASYESEREILHKAGELIAKRSQKRRSKRPGGESRSLSTDSESGLNGY